MKQHATHCTPRRTRPGLAIVTGLLAWVGLATMPACAGANQDVSMFEGMAVRVVGEGRPVLMIPGLNSAGEVWNETCAGLRKAPDPVQCHIVHLPGFAGQPAVQDAEPFLPSMRDRLLRYLDHAELENPVVMGHSLGGLLGLMMAIEVPDRLQALVVVDSLPFFAAAGNPAITEAQAAAMATAMRDGMRKVEDTQYQAQAELALANLSNRPERMDTLKDWGKRSDRHTTTQAMYELMAHDWREELATIRIPVRMLGAWAGFESYGATRESVGKIFTDQYAALPGVQIELSERGFHFLMWDDPEWLQQEVREFLAAHPQPES